jgi:hypothetical protein
VPGIGTIQGFCASSQAKAICAGVTSFLAAIRRIDQAPRLFASRERAGAYAARVLFLGAMMGFWFFITQYLQRVLDTVRSRPAWHSCR